MIEKHPFKPFVPKGVKHLLLGSFPGKEPGDWFYDTKRTQFWKTLESVYRRELMTKMNKQKLFRELKLAVIDIIYFCERSHENNLDYNLTKITYNTQAILGILNSEKISKIYFSSRFVEINFTEIFKSMHINPKIERITLPSPSPRYARMSLIEKIDIYRNLLPKLKKPWLWELFRIHSL